MVPSWRRTQAQPDFFRQRPGPCRRPKTFSGAAWALGSRNAKRYGQPQAERIGTVLNDVLLALSCREAGVVLVTANERDFERIRRRVRFEFVGPWLSPRG